MPPLDVFVIGCVTNGPLAERVDAALRPHLTHYALVRSIAEARRLLTDGPVPGAIVADTYDPNLVALAPSLPWVWLADPRTAFDRGVVLSPEHLDELPRAIEASVNLARCELALRLFRRRPTPALPSIAPPARSANAFEMHFQPRWSIDGSRLVGAEALLRWHGLDPGLTADQLVAGGDPPLVRLGDWIVDRTLIHLAACRALWPADATVSVNVSASQLVHPGFAALVVERLRTYGVPSGWLEIDIDIAAVADLGALHVGNLGALRAAGIGLVADRVGYAAFDPGRLAHLPFTALKLARELTADIPGRPHAVALSRRIVELAQRLNIPVVAVGVETHEQLDALRAAGCTAFQGFLLAEPMPPSELAALLVAHREARSTSLSN